MAALSEAAHLVCLAAANEAAARRHAYLEPEHLFVALCKAEDLFPESLPADFRRDIRNAPAATEELAGIVAAFAFADIDTRQARNEIRRRLGLGHTALEREIVHRSAACKTVFAAAERLAGEEREPTVQPRHFLRALLEADRPCVRAVLGGAATKLRKQLRSDGKAPRPDAGPPMPALSFQQMRADTLRRDARKPGRKRGMRPGDAEGEKAPSASVLESIGRDLTEEARQGKLDPVIGRADEMRRAAQILIQRRKNNPVLVGDPGVGKTCIVEGLAQIIVGDTPPPQLKGKRLVEITMAALLAGTKYRGDFEERLQNLVREAEADDELILFIDEIHTLVASGEGDGAMSASNILKPALARGKLSCIGATTTAEYRRYFEKDPALERRFQVVWVDEPDREEALAILRGLRPSLEKHHAVTLPDEALAAAVDLSMRYMTDARLPDKAIDLLDTAAARTVMGSIDEESSGFEFGLDGPALRPERVAEVVSERCRVPLEKLTTSEGERLLAMEETLRHRVIGQESAVRAVADAVRTARAGFKDPRKPVGVFFFVGLTGTGKTELAKALTEFLFDDESKLLRFDMSEFQQEGSSTKLIGSPPGYVGYEEEGQLTGRIRTTPYSVVLFDEIEKAHPSLYDLFLQIFDEGRLTDAKGRTVSFREAVVILTSNLGAREAYEMGYEPAAYEERILESLTRALRPELLARVGKTVFFHPLAEAHVRGIVEKTLASVRERLSAQSLTLALSDRAMARLIERGYTPAEGVRGLERLVNEELVEPIARAVLAGTYAPGATVTADWDGEAMRIR